MLTALDAARTASRPALGDALGGLRVSEACALRWRDVLRRTYCALLYESGATPVFAMAQMGHRSSSLALEMYSKVLERQRDTGARMDALLRGV